MATYANYFDVNCSNVQGRRCNVHILLNLKYRYKCKGKPNKPLCLSSQSCTCYGGICLQKTFWHQSHGTKEVGRFPNSVQVDTFNTTVTLRPIPCYKYHLLAMADAGNTDLGRCLCHYSQPVQVFSKARVPTKIAGFLTRR